MIFDDLENLANYGIFKTDATKKICDFIASLDGDLEDGKHEIDGDDIYANVQGYTTKDFGSSDLEMHKEYVDIQLLLVGEEAIYYSPNDNLVETKAYEFDFAFYKFNEQIASMLNLQVGKFAIFLPFELHMPCIDNLNGKSDVKKVVIKVAKQLLN